MAKNIIIFQNSPGEENSLLGFKILNQNSTKQLMKAISLLSNTNEKFEINDNLFEYDLEKFEVIKISSNDIKVLSKLFNIEEEDESIGIFPDAINDAYELGLLTDDEEDTDNDNYEEDYE